MLCCVVCVAVCCYVVDCASLAASHSLFSDPAPPRLTQPLSSRLFLAGDDVEDDEGGGGGDDEGGGGGDDDYEKNQKWFLLKQGAAVENFE